MSVKRKFCSLWIFTLVYATANAAVLEGEVTRIKDGDSLYVWNTEVRMVDIDAFEYSQKCAKNNKQYQCGALATKALKKLIAGREIRCEGVAVDRYDRLLATCFVGNQNINEAMVRAGWAVIIGVAQSIQAPRMRRRRISEGYGRASLWTHIHTDARAVLI